MNFEANAQNLQVLAGRLQETLSSEDQVRKDGKFGRTFLTDYLMEGSINKKRLLKSKKGVESLKEREIQS